LAQAGFSLFGFDQRNLEKSEGTPRFDVFAERWFADH